MKKITLLLITFGVVLAGCTQSPLKIGTTQSSTPNCATTGYYKNLKIDKELMFAWDESQSGYVVEIPELCVRLIARSSDPTLTPQEWKSWVEDPKRFIGGTDHLHVKVKNNEFFLGKDIKAHYIFKDKSADKSFLDQINDDYRLGIDYDDDEEHTFLGEDYCEPVLDANTPRYEDMYTKIHMQGEPDAAVQYHIKTPYQIAARHNIWPRSMYSQICDIFYPYQDGGFGRIHLYNILYSQKYPLRYLIYEPFQTQADIDPVENLTVEYLD